MTFGGAIAGMTPDDWQRIKRIVAAAHDRPEPQWTALVAAACGGDAWLRCEVHSLLRSTDAAALLYELPEPRPSQVRRLR